jgi:hypothetical protein
MRAPGVSTVASRSHRQAWASSSRLAVQYPVPPACSLTATSLALARAVATLAFVLAAAVLGPAAAVLVSTAAVLVPTAAVLVPAAALLVPAAAPPVLVPAAVVAFGAAVAVFVPGDAAAVLRDRGAALLTRTAVGPGDPQPASVTAVRVTAASAAPVIRSLIGIPRLCCFPLRRPAALLSAEAPSCPP